VLVIQSVELTNYNGIPIAGAVVVEADGVGALQ